VLAWVQSQESTGGRYGPNDVTLRAQILCSENRWEVAPSLSRPFAETP
jgi:hypothetical protein